jgi:hypothetical protein
MVPIMGMENRKRGMIEVGVKVLRRVGAQIEVLEVATRMLEVMVVEAMVVIVARN